ncbi:MAG: hypothetical protein AB8B51_13630, partial [Sedimentitalea sp.]
MRDAAQFTPGGSDLARAVTSKATTVSRADREKAKIWIEGALRMIVQNGVSAVKVEPLARTLKVSK